MTADFSNELFLLGGDLKGVVVRIMLEPSGWKYVVEGDELTPSERLMVATVLDVIARKMREAV